MVATTAEDLRPLSSEDLANYPDDGKRREIINGELIVTPMPIPNHQLVSLNLSALMLGFARKHKRGRVYPAPDVRLTLRDVVAPDIVFVSAERLIIVGKGSINGAPDLVVEILSPSTRRSDLVRKRAIYEREGVQEYWIVDLDRRTVEILGLIAGQYEPIREQDGRPVSHVLEGIVIDPSEVFADADPAHGE